MDEYLAGMLSFFNNYSRTEIYILYKRGVLSAEDIKELWDMLNLLNLVEPLAFSEAAKNAPEEHFMEEMRAWFRKYLAYRGL